MIHEILIVSLIGALLCLDDLVIGRFMVSMPLVTAPLVGWSLGDPHAGVAVGCLWQLLWVGSMPIGVVVPPSSPTMGVLGTAFAAMLGRSFAPGSVPFEAVVIFSLLAALPLAQLSSTIDHHLRKRNQFFARQAERRAASGTLVSVTPMLAGSIAVLFLKHALFFFITLISLQTLLSLVLGAMPEAVLRGLKSAYYMTPVIGFAAIFHVFSRRLHLVYFLASFLIATVFLYVLRVNEAALLTAVVACGMLIGVLRYAAARRAAQQEGG